MSVAAEALDIVLRDREARVAVIGPPGAGKSAAAHAIRQAVSDQGKVPVLVSPPSGAADAGALAVSSVRRQLGDRPHLGEDWPRAQREAQDLLHDRADDVVLIC